jgi:hypothetical protein
MGDKRGTETGSPVGRRAFLGLAPKLAGAALLGGFIVSAGNGCYGDYYNYVNYLNYYNSASASADKPAAKPATNPAD